jgi:hypothetical protein
MVRSGGLPAKRLVAERWLSLLPEAIRHVNASERAISSHMPWATPARRRAMSIVLC